VESPNATSGVLALICGRRKIVFPGDATLQDWRQIRKRLGAPVAADILAVPHHGGQVVPPSRSQQPAEELRWLYQEGIHCRHAVISVGTSNNYGHPESMTVAALRESGATIICTQITRQCHDDLESLRPGVVQPAFPSRSTRRRELTTSGNSRNVACAGTVISEIGPEAVTIRQLSAHQRAVDGLATTAGGHPLCRRMAG